jgi:RimJ/RimL family protein N-acetyltransferase
MFANSSLGRFASFIKPENEPSKRVVKRLGAVCEGTVDLRGSKMEHWVHHRH